MIRVEQHGPVLAICMSRALLGRPLHWATAYWVDGLLVDSGPAATAAQLGSVLDERHVDQIVVTHGHEEHIGGLHHLHRRFPQATLYAPLRTLPYIEAPAELRQPLYRRLLWGTPRPLQDVKALEDRITTPNFTFHVVETPGHSRDHVSFFEPNQRWIFSGDAYIGGQDTACGPELEMFSLISSLRTLAALRPERLFPGSGSVRRTVLPELHGKIGRLIGLCHDVSRLDATGMPTDEIVRHLFGAEPPTRTWTLGHLSAANLIRACRRYNEIFEPEPAVTSTPASPRFRQRKSSSSRSR